MSKFSKRKWKKEFNKGLTNMSYDQWQLIQYLYNKVLKNE